MYNSSKGKVSKRRVHSTLIELCQPAEHHGKWEAKSDEREGVSRCALY